eukprot:366036-Chlamydomonas_euryale.AAC.15
MRERFSRRGMGTAPGFPLRHHCRHQGLPQRVRRAALRAGSAHGRIRPPCAAQLRRRRRYDRRSSVVGAREGEPEVQLPAAARWQPPAAPRPIFPPPLFLSVARAATTREAARACTAALRGGVRAALL